MIRARILEPRSKPATARSLRSETLTHTLGEELGVADVGGDELYRAMDWLLKRQDRIERHLAAKHLEDGALVLRDATSGRVEQKDGCSTIVLLAVQTTDIRYLWGNGH